MLIIFIIFALLSIIFMSFLGDKMYYGGCYKEKEIRGSAKGGKCNGSAAKGYFSECENCPYYREGKGGKI